jgi:hypothetical protein
MVEAFHMSIDPLYGEGDYIEWEFFSKEYDTFLLFGADKSIYYQESGSNGLIEIDPLSCDNFSDESIVFYAKGVGIVRGFIEINKESDCSKLFKEPRYPQQMFSGYGVSYPNRFYQVMTEKNDLECELIWIPEANIKYAMPDIDLPQNSLPPSDKPLFNLGDKVNWRVFDNAAIMCIPIRDSNGNYDGYTEVRLQEVSGVINERTYRKFLPSTSHITNSREESVKEGRFWNQHIPLSRQGWVYKLEIQIYGEYGDFWVCEEDLSLVPVSEKIYDLVVVPPLSLIGIKQNQEAA